MKTKLHYVFTFVLIFVGFSVFGQANYFTKVSNTNSVDKLELNEQHAPKKFDTYSLDKTALQNVLTNAPLRGEPYSNLILDFPGLDGEMQKYQIFEASVMHPDLQARYPEIRSYVGYGLNDSAYFRFSISPYNGLNGIVLNSKNAIILESDRQNSDLVRVYQKSDQGKTIGFECSTLDLRNTSNNNGVQANGLRSADATLHTFDLAMSVTNEYSSYHGTTLPEVNAAINTTVTNVNGIFENDFNVTLAIIPGNDVLVYYDGVTDPYDSVDDSNYNQELADNLDLLLNDNDYDVGHLMGGIGGNGNAGCIGCVCVNGEVLTFNHKGSGYTTNTVPIGPAFDVDYVAHEIGHQFGGNHTFTHASEGGGIAQMEPGSGSTIMGYAGITGATDVQSNSDPYFHAISIQQITDHVASRTCDDETTLVNNVPVANAGGDITLPVGTPFKLTGSATDGDVGDMLTYCWEQFDEDNGTGGGFPDETSTNSNRPLFRSYNPSTSPTRTFPRLEDLLANGVNGNTWEKVPTVTRSADFRLTVRDNKPNGAANDFDDMVVNWDNIYGPFAVTSQSSTGITWVSGTLETITWDVLNTDALNGAANVNIWLSIDGGLTYPISLASNTPNDGTEIITVPSNPAPYCRIMIEPTGNQFFAVNTEDFALDYTISTTCNQYTSTDPNLPLAIDDNGSGYTQVSFVDVTESVTITDINVGVNITHPWIGDLLVGIQSPAGPPILNMMEPYDPCQNEDENVIVKFDDDGATFSCSITGDDLVLQSQQDALSGWNGENSSGQWLIGVGDFGAADVGTLNSWYIEVCVTTEMPLGLNDLVEITDLSIYPNPNRGEFSVKFNSSSDNANIEVNDLRGRSIFSKTFMNSTNFNETISLKNVQSGIYLVNVSDGARRSTKKIIIE